MPLIALGVLALVAGGVIEMLARRI
jgi:hypothetical protein